MFLRRVVDRVLLCNTATSITSTNLQKVTTLWVHPRRSFALKTKKAGSKEKIAVIGSGNWGSVAARILGQNAARLDLFDDHVNMWVYPERVNYKGKEQNLVDVINNTHENIKYAPGINIGTNVYAVSDLFQAIDGATMLVFVTPQQFIHGICAKLRGKLSPTTKGISLIKGMDVTTHGFKLVSELIRLELGIDCSVLMGANLASEIGLEQFCEATIGYSNLESGTLWQHAFKTPYFRVRAVPDVVGCELCGTLKSVVSLGAGFVDGLELGNNTKAAIIRIGLIELMDLARFCFPSVRMETFFESAGIADLFTSCAGTGGRNRRCAEEFARAGGLKSWEQIESDLLGGQKLQGTFMSQEVQDMLDKHELAAHFPLFTTINQIVNGKRPPSDITRFEIQLPFQDQTELYRGDN